MMRALSEWWLSRLGASDALIGDLCEVAARRPASWYWQQVASGTVVLTMRAIRREPWTWIRTAAVLAGVVLVGASLLSRSSGPGAEALDVRVEASGWLPMPAPDGRVRMIPAVVVRVGNPTARRLAGVQLNVVFRRANDGLEWDSVWRPRIGGRGLAPGGGTETVLVASQHGHVGSGAPLTLLEHPAFVDARVELFARYGAREWARLGTFDIPRTLARPMAAARSGHRPMRRLPSTVL
ncbi:MAG: hypothetical protein R2712_30335 [Vicinamibacterales bacterium]